METGGDQVGAGAAATATMKKKKLRVMAAVDDSENGFHALEWAIDHLTDLMSAEPETGQEGGLLTLVHVQPPFLHYIYPAGGTAAAAYASTSVPESVRKAQEESATALFTRALQICRGKMVKAETLLLEGDPKEMICQAVEQMHADLLVVGSRGHGMIKRALLGSVSDYCAHHVKCPIIIVKPPKETSASTATK